MPESRLPLSSLSLGFWAVVGIAALLPVPLLVDAAGHEDPKGRMAAAMATLLGLPIFEWSISAFVLWRLRAREFWLHAFWMSALLSVFVALLALLLSTLF